MRPQPAPRGCTAAVLPPDWVHIIYITMSHSASQISNVDGAVVTEAAEADPKQRRLLDAGGPIDDDETARQKMRDAEVKGPDDDETTGFDPDDVEDIKTHKKGLHPVDRMTPMSYFNCDGDLPMMRWLYVNGAATPDASKATSRSIFPFLIQLGQDRRKH